MENEDGHTPVLGPARRLSISPMSCTTAKAASRKSGWDRARAGRCILLLAASQAKLEILGWHTMALEWKLFKTDPALQACLIRPNAHIIPGAAGEPGRKTQTALGQIDNAS